MKTVPWDPLEAVPSLRPAIWLGFALAACLIQGPQFARSLRPAPSEGVDFFQEWASAKNYFHGLPIYTSHRVTVPRYLDLAVEKDNDRSLSPGAIHVGIDVNAHPPSSVLAVLPLAALSYPDATFVWNVISLAALAASLWLLCRGLKVRLSPWSIPPIIALLLVCSPVRQQIAQGQLNMILLLLLTGVWACHRSGRPAWAGALLGLATVFKLFPGFLFLFFALRNERRILLAGVCVVLGVTGLTLLVLGSPTYTTYVYDVLPQVEEFRGHWMNSSLPGFFTKLFGPVSTSARVTPFLASPMIARLGWILACVVLVAVWAWVVLRARSRTALDCAYGLSVVTMLLVSPITWDHYFVLLIVPLAMVWVRLPAAAAIRGAFLAIVVVLCLPPIPLWNALVPGGHRAGLATPLHTVTVLAYGTYGLLALFAFNTFIVLRNSAPAAASSDG